MLFQDVFRSCLIKMTRLEFAGNIVLMMGYNDF